MTVRTPEAAMRAVLATRERPSPPGALSNAMTFAWRALLKIKHLPEQLFDVVITPVMFTVLFTYIFGGAIGGSPEGYLQALLPGVLVQTVGFASSYTGFTMNTDISRGVFERFRTLPIWRPSPILGAMLGDVLRFSISGILVFVIGTILGYRAPAGILGVVGALTLICAFAFGLSWIFVTLGLLVRTPGSVMTLSFLILMPLTFASNVYVPPETMPGWLQSFVAVNPIALCTTAAREILNGTATTGQIAVSLIFPAALTVVLAPVAMALYYRRR